MIRKRNKEKGFTLIELMVVIAIITLLSTIVIVNIGAVRTKTRDAKRAADMYQLRNAIEMYANDHRGDYPPLGGCNSTSTGFLITVGCSLTSLSWNNAFPGNVFRSALVPKYISRLPVDPLNTLQNHYTYTLYYENTGPDFSFGWITNPTDYNATAYFEEAGSQRSCEKKISIPVKHMKTNPLTVPTDWCNVTMGGANFLQLFIDH